MTASRNAGSILAKALLNARLPAMTSTPRSIWRTAFLALARLAGDLGLAVGGVLFPAIPLGLPRTPYSTRGQRDSMGAHPSLLGLRSSVPRKNKLGLGNDSGPERQAAPKVHGRVPATPHSPGAGTFPSHTRYSI